MMIEWIGPPRTDFFLGMLLMFGTLGFTPPKSHPPSNPPAFAFALRSFGQSNTSRWAAVITIGSMSLHGTPCAKAKLRIGMAIERNRHFGKLRI